MCTAVEETDIEGILAAINTTELIVEIRSEKIQLNWPLRYRCSALPTELTSQLGVVYYVGSHNFKKNYVFMNYSDQSFWIKSALSLVRVEVYRQGFEE